MKRWERYVLIYVMYWRRWILYCLSFINYIIYVIKSEVNQQVSKKKYSSRFPFCFIDQKLQWDISDSAFGYANKTFSSQTATNALFTLCYCCYWTISNIVAIEIKRCYDTRLLYACRSFWIVAHLSVWDQFEKSKMMISWFKTASIDQ